MTATITPEFRQRIRDQFPALAAPMAFLENAGGSQVPRCVADAIHAYMLESYVQLGAGYTLSQQCTELVDRAHDFIRLMINAQAGHVILGPSTSALLHMLGECYGRTLEPGSEIIVAESGHEANVGPWKWLQERGMKLVWWRVDPGTCECPLTDLAELLSEKTALVAFPHVSNLLGDIVDVPAVTEMAHAAGARVVVDGVAYAPHRAIDVAAWDVDWYAYSAYKVYGPHMAVLYGRDDAVAELTGPNHFFVPRDEVPYKFELGGVCHEGCAGLLGLADYLKFLADSPADQPVTRRDITTACDIMTACELPLQQMLVDYLKEKPGVRIIGPQQADVSRVGTVSFVHEQLSSQQITATVDRSDVAIRYGHMYAYHLCEALGFEPEDGVVRTSLVHYNTPEEISRLIEVFEKVL